MHNAKQCVSGMARRMQLCLHHRWQQSCLWSSSMGAFWMHNTKICVFLVWHGERTYLCSKTAKKCLQIPSMGSCEMHIAWKYVFLALNRHTSSPKEPSKISLDTSYRGSWNARYQKSVFLVWCAERTYLYTKSDHNTVSGYLVQVCLKHIMLENVCFQFCTKICKKKCTLTPIAWVRLKYAVRKTVCLQCGPVANNQLMSSKTMVVGFCLRYSDLFCS